MTNRQRNQFLSDSAAHMTRAAELLLAAIRSDESGGELGEELRTMRGELGELHRRVESIARGRDLDLKDEGDFLALIPATENGRRFIARHNALAMRGEGLFAKQALGMCRHGRGIMDPDVRTQILEIIRADDVMPVTCEEG